MYKKKMLLSILAVILVTLIVSTPGSAVEDIAPWKTCFTYDVPGGTWAEGFHSYHFRTRFAGEDIIYDWAFGEITVSRDAPLYTGHVLLRGRSEMAWIPERGNLTQCTDVDAIHPDQPTRFLMCWVGGDSTYAEAQESYDGMLQVAVWDDVTSFHMVRQEILPQWPENYICSWTQR